MEGLQVEGVYSRGRSQSRLIWDDVGLFRFVRGRVFWTSRFRFRFGRLRWPISKIWIFQLGIRSKNITPELIGIEAPV